MNVGVDAWIMCKNKLKVLSVKQPSRALDGSGVTSSSDGDGVSRQSGGTPPVK